MRTCEDRFSAARVAFRPIVVALVLMRLGSSPAAAASLTRGPYLQLLTRQSVTVVWDTDTPAACALTIRPLDGVPTVHAGGTGTVCAIAIDGLTPGTSYA